ncbi:formate--tetrahydrofolate ligase [Corynebacterium lowii]|uniref:Formate--tetrahydrofolate ligase n=1 Tax=Corynebacterium lowii TaxID=1544413 RepID=A0A0Q0UCV5_9CORY|nr:formate--tetrahydrofolate ligase [Corynebacterium lowii]KQB85751.1 Formate--tetrahydrofolate ligase [Corynebacterium lowii]MDP9851053.1 formate--tetrahydrofolate ligase [Corynebacterium lowii]
MSLSDVEIAQNHPLEPIADIARRAGIPEGALIAYGTTKAKVNPSLLEEGKPGKLVLVTGMSPTPAGEGKSTVLIGLADALRAAGYNSLAALREPSQGPVMGIKGGAAGGGYSQVVPMEDINLHFTGDFHAIAAATNTLAALIDNHIHQGNALNIDPRQVTWQRCVDVNDRSLRGVITGLGGRAHGVPAETGFTITAASEIMAVLGLSEDLEDLKERIGRITIGYTYSGEPVTAADLGAQGALTVLLKDAIYPNLVQTLGGTPALVHGGPFANIAHGCNTLLATRTALQCGDVVVTEAGFGSDLGAEKFFDIKARYGLEVAGTVIVATIRSLKFNGEASDYAKEDTEALRRGLMNLERHVTNVRKFGVEPVVALNLFSADTAAEREVMAQWAEEFGVALSEVEVWAKGGEGAADLAAKVMAALGEGSHPLYDPEEGVEASITTIAREIYGAQNVEFSPRARKDLAQLRRWGWDRLPVCISKTQYSFSDDPKALGAPSGHTLHVRELIPRTGAGFVVVLTGDVMTMPGLPKKPAANAIDIASDGTISGLF